MEQITERFLSYVRLETTSDEALADKQCPSSDKELVLARQLVGELQALGLTDAALDEHGFVYATLPANAPRACDTVGFLAHMDTSSAASGRGVAPRIIRGYDGADIPLSDTVTTPVSDFPELQKLKGKDIIVTDGTTLLGADDKAGIAIIMTTLDRLQQHPEIPHGTLKICFTPDEETGTGITHIDLSRFVCDYAFTVDGGDIRQVEYETFNAATALIHFAGNGIHPGDAKGRMINALQLAVDFHNRLPVFQRPEFTEKREGFNHLISLSGSPAQAGSAYIIRNHDCALLEQQKRQFILIQDHMNAMLGRNCVTVTLKDSYRNMAEVFADHMDVIETAYRALEACGLTPRSDPVRGGTDGSWLSFHGVPTANLGTGGMNYHGVHELVCIQDMMTMTDVLTALVQEIEKKGKENR